ncbi:Predicted DNA-binding transcriptional regulator YafY, contains an HTH and WYL domains [Sporolituus thermophilus DSM 23256]|uniref:Predicted DNA-binding transcriptional regulator YafY, contains an HTH and WYL domains n=1 Tax=Sporolituus thermophilus DSM 23256 TaxID=1123285 RepID=A0A1G7PCH1_9FIRM|nr:Predicted DNA-binding transcriptional regulator YafY, contains an HTH and WYL domains [Sporolituus thermophilus DSM 23256]
MDLPRSEKLLRLLKIISLIEHRQGATIETLVGECGVCQRTIYRDIRALAESGLPVYYDSATRRYRFTRQVFLRPLTFTVDEASALLQCLDGFDHHTFPLANALRSAQDKVLACLPSERKEEVRRLRTVIDIRFDAPYQVSIATFTTLEKAINDQRRLHIVYYTKTRDAITERDVDPYVIVYRDKAWYLIAYCHLRQAVKLFRVDRILELSVLPASFTRPEFSVEDFFAGSWHIGQGEPLTVLLKFAPAAAKWVKDAVFHPTPQLREESNGMLWFEVTVNGDWEITRWILSFGPEVEVVSPGWLRQKVATLLRDAVQIYDK